MGLGTHLLVLALSVQLPPVLNPTVYLSASGELSLEIDPGEPDGSGAGHYTFTRRGEVVWERDHPFTFFDAAVGDDGIVAGVSYSLGLGGGRYDESQGDLRLVVLAPNGTARFEHVMPRKNTLVIHGFPAPQSNGVLLDEVNGRVLMRLDREGAGGEEWWLYDLSTGEPAGRFIPAGPAQSYLAGVRRLTEGSLFLAHWELPEASLFRILTPELESIWALTLTTPPDADSFSGSTIDAITAEGFTLASPDSTLIDFEVMRVGEKFVVSQSGGRPAPRPVDVLSSARDVQLPLLDTIDLGSPEVHPVRRVYNFDIDGTGRLGFIPCEPNEPSLTVVDQAGDVVAIVALEHAWSEQNCRLVAWLDGDTWVVAARDAEGDVAKLYAVDIDARRARPFAALEGAYLSVLRPARGQGIFVLHGLSDVLRRLDPNGGEVVRLSQDYNDDRALFSPADVAALPNGRFAVLDVIRHVVQRFDSHGDFVDAIDLEASLGKEPGYPANFAVSPGGDYAIWDSGAAKPLILLTSAGVLRAELTPRYDDGRPTGRLNDVRYAPDGTLWATDGEALLRLNDDGIVDAVVGRRPTDGQLTEVSSAARDARGGYYLLDRRTASVHVFDSEGVFVQRCEPAPDDFDDQLDTAQISVAGDGTVYLSNGSRDEYLVFDAEGRRRERRSTRLDTIAEDWHAQPGGSDLWITTMDDLFLTDASGDVLRRICRHGDRTWLDSPAEAAVATDGSVALLTGRRNDLSPVGAKLGVFTVGGEAILTEEFPGLESFAAIAFEGDLIVLGTDGALIFLDSGGEPLGRFSPGVGYDRGHWRHFLSDEGRVLELLDMTRRRVYRYDLSSLR